MKIAVIYDRINKFGGAERLISFVADSLKAKDIYTLVYDEKKAKWAQKYNIHPSFLNKISFLRSRHQYLSLIAPLAFETFDLSDYDLVVSITSEYSKAVITKPETKHVCLCLTPTRYLWSARKQYVATPGMGKLSTLASMVLKKSKKYLQKADIIYSNRPDKIISISKEVQKRVKKYYKIDSDILYPPINFDYWSSVMRDQKDFYLVVSRLEPYKKVDLVIKTFEQLPDKKLVIVGIGSQIDKLKKISSKNITFKGQVSDHELRSLYSHAKALIFPQVEDFGLTALEAQAAGTPVIAYKKAGALETVLDGKTGIFFNKQTVNSLLMSLNKFEKHHFNPIDCRKNANKFSQKSFSKTLLIN